MKKYTKLSSASPVNMSNDWYDIANKEHFWIRRRFEIFKKICPWFENVKDPIADIGCGNGLLQRQIEVTYNKRVDGFDLNEFALQKNICHESEIYYYNIHNKSDQLFEKYGVIFMFDVIEHIEDEKEFFESVLFHLKPNGSLIVNVPASMIFYSKYDVIAGHLRRYSIKDIFNLGKKLNLDVAEVTYWGLPMSSLLLIRKFLLKKESRKKIIQKGFKPPNKFMNGLLMKYSRLERIPQQLFGTSIMAVFKKSYYKLST